ncbi:MAG: hypothetical protein MJB14_19255 [Spirochaetes bacterium]|nr:hypothetical protein [Spirochaetota bacterium]
MNKKLMMKSFFLKISIVLMLFSLFSCKEKTPYYQFADEYQNSKWQELQSKITLLQKNLEEKIEWADEVYLLFMEADKKEELVQYFTEMAIHFKDDIFSSYLYFVVSDIYWGMEKKEISLYYITQVKEEIFPVKYDYQEIGFLISLRKIKFDHYQQLKLDNCHILITEYADLIDDVQVLNEMAALYKEQFDIKNAIATMEKILKITDNKKIKDHNINLAKIREEIQFYHSSKDWIYQDLQELINKIKSAIQRKNRKLLDSYVSDVDFQIKFFQTEMQFNWTYREIAVHLRWNNNIVFSRNLEEYSNENEAFLETKNWSLRQMRVWYFYFKRINYPYDEKIDGGWEWKGIYFGNYY